MSILSKLYFRLADHVGILAFYPVFYIVGLFISVILAFAAKILYFLFSLFVGIDIYLLSKHYDSRRFLVSSIIIVVSSVLMLILYSIDLLVVSLESIYILMLILDALPLVLLGLFFHDFSKTGKMILYRKLDRSGGLVILGVILVLLPTVFISYIGVLLLIIGLGTASRIFRELGFLSLEQSKKASK